MEKITKEQADIIGEVANICTHAGRCDYDIQSELAKYYLDKYSEKCLDISHKVISEYALIIVK